MDAAQGAGMAEISLRKLGADFIAMPGHKGLLGPQGTGILLCGRLPQILLAGGTGSDSKIQEMPAYLPERAEPGTMNVPGIAGLTAGMEIVLRKKPERILQREQENARRCIHLLEKKGYRVFSGEHQSGTVSFVPDIDCEEMAEKMATRGIAVRAGLHCAPLAHESAGTLQTGTVRISFGHEASIGQYMAFAGEFGRI
jgi:selenocysteine lyase/cysteine desulfurase